MTSISPRDEGTLPNLLICGAPKAGTSSLHVWLSDHPDALGSSEKETYFYVDPDTHMYRPDANIVNGLAGYSRYFHTKKGRVPRVVLESTSAYMYHKAALRYVPELPTSPKCIFVLREPAEQIYSLFTYFQTNWSWIPADMSFGEYLGVLRTGERDDVFSGNELASGALKNARYVDFLLGWRDRLGSERMKVYSFEALKYDPKVFVQEVADWIGLDPAFYDSYEFSRDNETYAVRNIALQRMNVAVRGLLPHGPVYRALRGVYRKLNIRAPDEKIADEQALIAELARDYADANALLRAEFGLELPGWA